MKYFIQTVRFNPSSFEQLGFEHIKDDLFYFKEDGSTWQKRELADIGWGNENGLCRLPMLSFDKLINLAFIETKKERKGVKNFFNSFFKKRESHTTDETYNFWGAISVLLSDHCEQLIKYVSQNFKPQELNEKYPEVYRYINSTLNLPENYLNKVSDEKLVYCCSLWKEWLEG